MFNFGPSTTININLFGPGKSEKPKKKIVVAGTETKELLSIFEGQETLFGAAEIVIPPGKKVDHLGIKIEMIGQIELYYERGNCMKFTSLVRELEVAGSLLQSSTYPFEFTTEKPYESYSGINVRLRYFIRVTISRSYNTSIIKEQDFFVQNSTKSPVIELNSIVDTNRVDTSPSVSEGDQVTTPATSTSVVPSAASSSPSLARPPIRMEVGIEDCLHIEFEYDKQKYHLKDVIHGKIYFLLVRIKIKHMELAVIRRESAGSGSNQCNESETVTKFELMDGAPVKGECVPIRLYLKPLETLTPTYRAINNIFSVKYFLNLVLVDEEDRRYFKQHEIQLWRSIDAK